MSKNGLGRGLGSLMGDEKPASPAEAAAAADPASTPSTLAGPGVGSLLRGARPGGKNVFAEPATASAPVSVPFEAAAKKPLIPTWYFFAADVLLIAFALLVFSKSSGPLTGREAFLCMASIALAGILGVIGVWLGRKSGS